MDNKYFLVPSDLYNNLLKPDTGSISIENSKNILNKIANKKKLNKSIQNVLYNQELRRYLKLKKEIENKPVKVELSNGARLLFSPKYIPKKRGKKQFIKGNFFNPETGDEGDFDSLEGFETAKSETPMDEEKFFEEEETKPSASIESPKLTKEEKKYKLLAIIRNNQEKFGISPKGKILTSYGRPIARSNFEEALEGIINKKSRDVLSPPGKATLEHRLKNDEETKQYLINTKRKQKGKGKKEIKKQKRKGLYKKKIILFKPKKWL